MGNNLSIHSWLSFNCHRDRDLYQCRVGYAPKGPSVWLVKYGCPGSGQPNRPRTRGVVAVKKGSMYSRSPYMKGLANRVQRSLSRRHMDKVQKARCVRLLAKGWAACTRYDE